MYHFVFFFGHASSFTTITDLKKNKQTNNNNNNKTKTKTKQKHKQKKEQNKIKQQNKQNKNKIKTTQLKQTSKNTKRIGCHSEYLVKVNSIDILTCQRQRHPSQSTY